MRRAENSGTFRIPLKYGLQISYIGPRDFYFNRDQYTRHFQDYLDDNSDGLRGGLTPTERVSIFHQYFPEVKNVLEIGAGPGHDGMAFKKAGRLDSYKASDISPPFVEHHRAIGLDSMVFDARTDPIPEGIDGIFAHISLLHLGPKELAGFLARARNTLPPDGAIYMSFIEGYGHEITARTGKFRRLFYFYTHSRLKQITDQEGIVQGFQQDVRAKNGTRTIHYGGNFEHGYQKFSYGEKGLHPFGDVYYTPDALYRKKLTLDLVDAQVKDGLLPVEKRNFIKDIERDYNSNTIKLDELMRRINREWAEGLKGKEISVVIQHTKDYLDQQEVNPLIATALAICNYNGFSNTLIGYEPSWLLDVFSKRFGLDQVIPSVQWKTDGIQFTGKITGDIFYVDGTPNPKAAVLRHQRNLRKRINSVYKRTTVGVGQSAQDTDLLAETDYPIFAAPTEENKSIAERYGLFINSNKEPIIMDSKLWPKWKVTKDETDLVRYLHIITSGVFPIRPNRSDYIAERLTWTSPFNHIKRDLLSYYKANRIPIQTL